MAKTDLKRIHRVRRGDKIHRYHRHTRKRLPECESEDDPAFVAAYMAEDEAHLSRAAERKRRLAEARAQERLRGYIDNERQMLSRSKYRANSKSMDFDLSREALRAMLVEQRYRCAVSGIAFDVRESRRNPFAPSIDRIDCKGGYVLGNVRLVCRMVNFALNEFGDEVFFEMCEQTVKNRGRTL